MFDGLTSRILGIGEGRTLLLPLGLGSNDRSGAAVSGGNLGVVGLALPVLWVVAAIPKVLRVLGEAGGVVWCLRERDR